MTVEKPPNIVREKFPEIMQAAFQFFMLQWHNDTLPKHFTREAPEKWHYDKRTKIYQNRKNRKSLPPLVWTGDSRRRLLASVRIELRGKHPVRATGKFDAPQYFWMRKENDPDKGGEFMRINPDEWNGIAERINNYIWQKIDETEMTEYYGFDYH